MPIPVGMPGTHLGDLRSKLGATASDRQPATADALARVWAALGRGDQPGAMSLLEYAQRLAPSDKGIMFAIALLRLEMKDKRASEPLELLADSTGWNEPMILLAGCRLDAGDVDAATMLLHDVLRSSAPDQNAYFLRLVSDISIASRAKGWCCLNNDGMLTIGGVAKLAPHLIVSLDSRPALYSEAATVTGASVRTLKLLDPWFSARRLEVSIDNLPLLGSPIEISQVTRFEGFVEVVDGGLAGWAWFPGDRNSIPQIELGNPDGNGFRIFVKPKLLHKNLSLFPAFSAPRQFSLAANRLARFKNSINVTGPYGKIVYGSPIRPGDALASAKRGAGFVKTLFPLVGSAAVSALEIMREPSIPVAFLPPKIARVRDKLRREVVVIIPVYRGLEVTMACVESVISSRSINERILVISDASPDLRLQEKLRTLAETGVIELRIETTNRGFPGTVNLGLRLTAGNDVVLLNSDTLVPPGWLARMREAAYSRPDIGTVTPIANDATVFSYPLPDVSNPIPSLEDTIRIDASAAVVNAGVTVEAPTGHGFCLFIKAACVADTGVLREDVFAQGYAEENDFCLRARVFGWRHVCAPNVFIGHVGGQSFASTKTHLIERNLKTLNRLHVGYDSLIQDWIKTDPMASSRRRLDEAFLVKLTSDREAILIVTHSRQGGVLRHVNERTLAHEVAGFLPMTLVPLAKVNGKHRCRLKIGTDDELPNLTFTMPDDVKSLRGILDRSRLRSSEIHHFIGHHQSVFDLILSSGRPYDIICHDYSWFCPRITLTGKNNKYCGEPVVSECTICISDNGNQIEDSIDPVDLRARSLHLFHRARNVIAPSNDTARRFQRYFSVAPKIGRWERPFTLRLKPFKKAVNSERRVCIVGAIGREKGYDLLLACARYAAARNLPLRFMLVGYSLDDARLLDTGHVSITGHFNEREAVSLIKAQNADLGFLPALWPETWSYTLSQMWQASLPVVAFDMGAQAERIRTSAGGLLLPMGLTPERVADYLAAPSAE